MKMRIYQIVVAAMLSGCSIQTNPLSLTYIDQSASYPSSKNDVDDAVKKIEPIKQEQPIKKEQKKKVFCSMFYLPKLRSSPTITDDDLSNIDKTNSKALNKALLDHIEDLNAYINEMRRKYEDAARRQRNSCTVD